MKGVEELVRGGMDGGELGEDFFRRFGGVDFLGDAGELGLIAMEVGVGDLEQVGERDVDHLVVAELVGEGGGAEAIVAGGAREQVGLQPVAIAFESVDDGGVRGGEVGQGLLVGGVFEGFGDIGLKEGDDAVDLFEGDLGEDARRVLEVLARGGEDGGHGALAGDGGLQADVDGGEGSLHEDEDGVGDAGGVVVRILFPVADGLKRKELGVDGVEQDLPVGGDGGVEGVGRDGGDFALEGVKGGDVFLYGGGGVVLELRIVLMEAGLGAGGGGEAEKDVGEVLVGEGAEGLGAAIGGETLGGHGGIQEHGCTEGGEEETHVSQCTEDAACVMQAAAG